MPDPVDPKTLLTLVEMSIDSMYELEAIGEPLEQKGVITKDEIFTLAKELKRKTPPIESHTVSTPNPSPQRFTAKENAVIEELMGVILQHGFSTDLAKTLLGRTIQFWNGASRLGTSRLRRTLSPSCISFIRQIL